MTMHKVSMAQTCYSYRINEQRFVGVNMSAFVFWTSEVTLKVYGKKVNVKLKSSWSII